MKNGKGVYDVDGFCKDVEDGRRPLTKDFVKYFLYGYGQMLWDMAGVQHLYGDSKSTITHFASQEAGMRILESTGTAAMCALSSSLPMGITKVAFWKYLSRRRTNGFGWIRDTVRPLSRAD
jgi:hypothetical protein